MAMNITTRTTGIAKKLLLDKQIAKFNASVLTLKNQCIAYIIEDN